ncbi:MAG: DUF4259 domain-containing protein [Planctomycetales bacterium]|nr:DUF4259 domain-containing protein [bacterium]UNM07518.1 MAG: DUF4259 domain-containing protein [Planctomycetales bacterium]
MECWGIGPFENEHALHWTAALAAGSAHPDAVVQQVLAREGRLPLELSIEAVCSATMAANTTVRVKKISMPREAWQWMDRERFDCTAVPRNDYRRALLRVATDSELELRWQDNPEYADWRRMLVRIEQRFTPTPHLKFVLPDYANEREPFWYWRIRQPAIYRQLQAGTFGVDRRAHERFTIELQCSEVEFSEAAIHAAAQIGNRQLQLNGLGRLDSADGPRGSVFFRTHRGLQRDALRLLTASLRRCGLPREAVFFYANRERTGPFNIARRLYPQRLRRREGVAGTAMTKLVASLRFQKPGAIFCYQAVPGFWHYGRVMSISSDVGVGPDCMLLHFYRESSVHMTSLPDFKLDTLLCQPVVTDRSAWAMGMFQTVDKIPLSAAEQQAVGGVAAPLRIEELGRHGQAQGDAAAEPQLTAHSFSRYIEIDELLCQALDIPLSPLELEE